MPCAGKGGRAPGLAGSRILDPSLHTRLCSPVIHRQLRVNSSPPWKFRSKVLLVQRNMIKLGPFVFACVVGFFFSEGTCVGRAAGRAWHTDGQILTIRKSASAACACGRAGISAGKVTIGPELVFSQGCVSGPAWNWQVWVQLAEPLSLWCSPKPTPKEGWLRDFPEAWEMEGLKFYPLGKATSPCCW